MKSAEKKNPNKSINFQNIYLKSSDCPSFSQLKMPLTESEWRRNQTALNQLKKQSTTNQGNESGCTTVNPRERPKGNVNNVNSIILPPASSSNNTSTSINNMNVKPRTQSNAPSNKQSPFQTSYNVNVNVIAPTTSSAFTNSKNNNILGFDDDFNSTPIHVYTNSNQNMASLPLNASNNSLNVNNKSPLLLPAPNERKSHRRSVSQ